ncbi:hypothetical protein [uncultured Winogradskyella sp.]|uniref:hypothetical protein n=1 Tax=uncultured Winogradskyella sp. TaxID=395353 RepID=UPI00260490B6|nr:hypothetical protein [uncultured Winogradskyella sp.]
MKKLIFTLFSLASLVLITSCESDDDASTNSDASIEGTWLLTAWNSSIPLDLNNDGTASTNLLDEVNCLTNETIVFDANGGAVVNSTSFLDLEIFVESGTTDSFEFEVNCEFEDETFALAYTRVDNPVILTEIGESEGFVGTLNGNELNLDLEEEFEIYDDEFEVAGTIDLNIVYTKQ